MNYDVNTIASLEERIVAQLLSDPERLNSLISKVSQSVGGLSAQTTGQV